MTPFKDPLAWQEAYGRLLVTVKTGSYCSFDQQPTNGLHHHDYHEICLITAGTGTYAYSGSAHTLTPGDVILAKPDDLHEISSLQSRDLELVFFSFDIHGGPIKSSGGEKEKLIQEIRESRTVHASGHRRLLGYLQILSRDLTPSWVLTRTLGTFFTELLSAIVPMVPTITDSEQTTIVRRAIDIIDQHIRRSLTVSALAEAIGISERSLRRYFSQELDKTIVEVIRERKLNRASALLLMNFDVGSVSHMLSMDLSHFSRSFKCQFGCTPSAYQKAYRSQLTSSQSTVHRLPQA